MTTEAKEVVKQIIKGSYQSIEGEEAIKNCEGVQMWQGQWWMPLYGCDTLDHLADDFAEAIDRDINNKTTKEK